MNKSGVGTRFPEQLMDLLNSNEYSDIIMWLPEGCGFFISDKKRFAEEVLPKHFQGTKYTSFTRRLRRWDFTIQTDGHKKASYFHPAFIRGKPELCRKVVAVQQVRKKRKDTHDKASSAYWNNARASNVGDQMPMLPSLIGYQDFSGRDTNSNAGKFSNSTVASAKPQSQCIGRNDNTVFSSPMAANLSTNVRNANNSLVARTSLANSDSTNSSFGMYSTFNSSASNPSNLGLRSANESTGIYRQPQHNPRHNPSHRIDPLMDHQTHNGHKQAPGNPSTMAGANMNNFQLYNEIHGTNIGIPYRNIYTPNVVDNMNMLIQDQQRIQLLHLNDKQNLIDQDTRQHQAYLSQRNNSQLQHAQLEMNMHPRNYAMNTPGQSMQPIINHASAIPRTPREDSITRICENNGMVPRLGNEQIFLNRHRHEYQYTLNSNHDNNNGRLEQFSFRPNEK